MTDSPSPASSRPPVTAGAPGGAPGPQCDHRLELADGRRLSWAEYGDAQGRPVLVLHGTPGSRLQLAPLEQAARAHGVRVIATDRPGCGLSTPRPGLSFDGYADDLRQLLDALDLQHVTLAGVSGGGGFALAAARLLPDRVARLVLVCAMVPGVPEHSLQGQATHVRRFFAMAGWLPGLTSLVVSRMSKTAEGPGPKLERRIRPMPEADKRVLRALAADASNAARTQEAVRQGARHAVAELALYRTVPDVPHSSVTVPAVLLHGADDVNVPIGVALWLRDQLPDAELVEVPDAGHLFLVERPELLLERVV